MIKNVLISVSDKTNLEKLCKFFVDKKFNIYATSSTYNYIKSFNIKCNKLSDLIEFPEILDGRVKTLNPKIYGGILADFKNKTHLLDLKKFNLKVFDYIIVNLYPFEKALNSNYEISKAIELIDIGGVSLLRAAAKNYRYCLPIFDINDYNFIIKNDNKNLSIETRLWFAAKTFGYVSYYDAKISEYFSAKTNQRFFDNYALPLKKVTKLRYGENPHQEAYAYEISKNNLFNNLNQIHGKELSFNNINDINSALKLLIEFSNSPTVVGLKHTNPCCVASDKNIDVAWDKAYEGDKQSIFGGIVAFNKEFSESTAKKLSKIFLEIIIAPCFNDESLKILMQKKNIRLITVNLNKLFSKNEIECKNIFNGLLIQDYDSKNDKITFTKKTNDNKNIDRKNLEFAWKISKHLKSNAVCITKDTQLLGIGCGQTSRIKAVEQCIKHVKANFNLSDCVLASDAFFPFPDSIVEIAKSNIVNSIIEPGGSINDKLVIQAANDNNLSLYFTNIRHFKH